LSISSCRQAAEAPQARSLVQDIQDRGELRVGVDEGIPLVYKDVGTGEWVGYYMDFINFWAEALGVEVLPVPTTWGNMVAGLQANQFDVAVALNPRTARALSVDFSDPLTYELDAFAINENQTDAGTWEELNTPERKICVSTGSAPDLVLTAFEPAAEIVRLKDDIACQTALASGTVDAFFYAWVNLGALAKANPGTKLIFPPAPLGKAGTAFAIPKGYSYSDILAINVALQEFKDSGKLAEAWAAYDVPNPLDYAIGEIPEYAYTFSP
jgi:polar amino acid transport system substrate-binding protein